VVTWTTTVCLLSLFLKPSTTATGAVAAIRLAAKSDTRLSGSWLTLWLQWIAITANGRTAYGLTRDSCPSCGQGDLGTSIYCPADLQDLIVPIIVDMSPSLFKNFAGLDAGELKISWHFMTKGFKP
jgi:hypothetical protein